MIGSRREPTACCGFMTASFTPSRHPEDLMLCQICGKNPASVHFTEIHDSKMSEIHVCERCAEEKGMHASAQQHKFEIADLLAGMVDAMTRTDEERVGHVQCARCGLLYSAFKETGRLGCSE